MLNNIIVKKTTIVKASNIAIVYIRARLLYCSINVFLKFGDFLNVIAKSKTILLFLYVIPYSYISIF